MFDVIAISYLLIITFLFIKVACKGVLYIFSPLLVIEIPFITQCLLPYYVLNKVENLDAVFEYIIVSSIGVHLCLLYVFRKVLFTPVRLIDSIYPKKKFGMLLFCLFVVLSAGIYSGVTLGLLGGVNVENLRRSSEIGLGFITEIPIYIIQIITLSLLLKNEQRGIVEAFVIVLGIGILLFLSKGHKAIFASIILLFLIYYNIRKRGFKIYEYIIFYFIQPLVAAFLQTIRGGSLNDIMDNLKTFITYPFLLFQVNTIPVVNKINEGDFLYGLEYYSALVQFIPRFLWPDKPVSFDYYYKTLIEYEFDGGGVPIPNEFSFWTNFSYFAPIFLLLWNLLIYLFYIKIIYSKNRYTHILLLILLVGPLRPSVVIPKLEWAFLTTIILSFYYRKKRIVDI